MGGLAQMRLVDFIEAVAAKTPTPGGGSVAAAVGAMGAALGIMAARFSEGAIPMEGASRLEELKSRLSAFIDADAEAYELVHSARGLPKGSDEEKARRSNAVQNALAEAADVPRNGMRLIVEALEALDAMAAEVNPNLSSDLASAALMLSAGLGGCEMNVLINAGSIKDRKKSGPLKKEAAALAKKGAALTSKVLRDVRKVYAKK